MQNVIHRLEQFYRRTQIIAWVSHYNGRLRCSDTASAVSVYIASPIVSEVMTRTDSFDSPCRILGFRKGL